MKENEATPERVPASRFEENIDFYYDGGLMVLTAHFLLRRGYCCGNGCRHCPYDRECQKPQSK